MARLQTVRIFMFMCIGHVENYLYNTIKLEFVRRLLYHLKSLSVPCFHLDFKWEVIPCQNTFHREQVASKANLDWVDKVAITPGPGDGTRNRHFNFCNRGLVSMPCGFESDFFCQLLNRRDTDLLT